MSKRRGREDEMYDEDMEEDFTKRYREDSSEDMEEETEDVEDSKRIREEETTSAEIEEHMTKRKRVTTHNGKSVSIKIEITVDDDRPTDIPNIMAIPSELRKSWMKQSSNPYGWPLEYLDIYNREKLITNPTGFQGTMKINNVLLYENQGDQPIGRECIQNFRNRNCIKSNTKEKGDDEVSIGSSFNEYLRNRGIFYINEKEEDDFDLFISRMEGFCNEYDNDTMSIFKSFPMDSYFVQKRHHFNTKKYSLDDLSFIDYLSFDKLSFTDNCNLTDYWLKKEFHEEFFNRHKLLIENKYRPLHNFLIDNKLDIYQLTIQIIKLFLGEYAQFVCIAGGFSLSKYVFDNYGEKIKFNDIDLFIHSCDEETANKICNILGMFTGILENGKFENENVYENENVIYSFFMDMLDIAGEDNTYGNCRNVQYTGHKSIQIIKRLYTCPAQIILGFDVDSCCILTTLDGDTYVTERGAYAIRKGYNMMNFDRMSPSYEYRLGKYNKRGFAIWIPFMEHFKANAVFDCNQFDRKKGSTVLLRHLITEDFRGVRINKETSDYWGGGDKKLYKGEYIKFKTLNPGEQIINTFHRIVLEDPIEWYPVRDSTVHQDIQVNNESMNTVEVLCGSYARLQSAMNIIRAIRSKKITSPKIGYMCNTIIGKINQFLPGAILSGGIVRGAISGIGSHSIEIIHDSLTTEVACTKLNYYLHQCVGLLYVKMSLSPLFEQIPIFSSMNIEDLGRIVFRESRTLSSDSLLNKTISDRSLISEEDNLHNFTMYETSGYKEYDFTPASFCGFMNYKDSQFGKKDHLKKLNYFYPSPTLSTIIDAYLESDQFIDRFFPNITSQECKTLTKDEILEKVLMREIDYNGFVKISPMIGKDKIYDYIYELFPESSKIKISEYMITYNKLLEVKDYETIIRLLSFKRRPFNSAYFEKSNLPASEIEEQSKIHTLVENNYIYNLSIKNKLIYNEFYSQIILYDNKSFKKFLFIYKYFRAIKTEIHTLTLPHLFEEDQKMILSHNGRFYGTEYDLKLLTLGTDSDEISNGLIKILPYPAYENYIPC